jgi:hypothetical protein
MIFEFLKLVNNFGMRTLPTNPLPPVTTISIYELTLLNFGKKAI